MKKLSAFLIFIVIVGTTHAVWASRLPSLKSVQSITTSFFKNYAKKHTDSILGQNKPTLVQINNVAELQRHLALVDAIVQLENGRSMRVFINIEKNPPFGWHVDSWETIEVR